MLVSVTHDDVVNGVRQSPLKNPVAVAVKRALGCDYVSAGTTIYMERGTKKALRHMSDEVAHFTMRYDRYKAVGPFSFELEDFD